MDISFSWVYSLKKPLPLSFSTRENNNTCGDGLELAILEIYISICVPLPCSIRIFSFFLDFVDFIESKDIEENEENTYFKIPVYLR